MAQKGNETLCSDCPLACKHLGQLLTVETGAVTNPATGGVVCRSSLTRPGNGCVPLNILGENNVTREAAAYVQADMYNKLTTSQLVAEASVRGDAFDLPAGSVSVAFGGGYRREKATGVGDPISSAPNPITGLPGGFFLTNRRALSGAFDTKELFGETVIPLLRDMPFAETVDLNAAVRYTNYSTSGSVVTWKIGSSALGIVAQREVQRRHAGSAGNRPLSFLERGDLFLALGRYNGSRGRAEYPNLVFGARRAWEFPVA